VGAPNDLPGAVDVVVAPGAAVLFEPDDEHAPVARAATTTATSTGRLRRRIR